MVTLKKKKKKVYCFQLLMGLIGKLTLTPGMAGGRSGGGPVSLRGGAHLHTQNPCGSSPFGRDPLIRE